MSDNHHRVDRTSPPRSDSEEERLVDSVLAPAPDAVDEQAFRPIYAVIPQHIIEASPEEFSTFLESVFEEDGDLDELLDRFFTPATTTDGRQGSAIRAVIPTEILKYRDADLFLAQLFNAFDEIDDAILAIDNLGTDAAESAPEFETVVVPEDDIADPEQLLRAIDRAHSEAAKLKIFLRQAKHILKRLNVYRLSRMPPGRLVSEMRTADDVRTVQYLVEFLRSIHNAAESFEALELPRPHVKDYLEYLYRMEDWDTVATLVLRLRQAVIRHLSGGGAR